MSLHPTEPTSSPTTGLYSIGTLRYNRHQIIVLFSWLLWGDFAFNFFEAIFGRFMPLYLKEIHASNTLIGITTGSIAGIVNVFFLPNISLWCDRLRTRIGRRIPLLLVVTPLVTLSLLGIGFAPEIGTWVHDCIPSSWTLFPSLNNTLLAFLCLCAVSFHFFNMVLINAFNWLLRDVVPQVFIARFLSWFRIVGTVATVIFLWFVFPRMMENRRAVFTGVSLFYLIVFILMCWKVREGDYPEPPPRTAESNFIRRFGSFFKDCLALPIYRNYFIGSTLFLLATWCSGTFLTLYAKETLKLDYDNMGRIWVYAQIVSAGVFAPAAWLCDKFSAIKVALTSLGALTACYLISFCCVSSKADWLLFSIISAVPTVTWGLSSLTLTMQLFPSKVFGQFSAGLNVFGCAGVIGGNYILGQIMDWTGSHYQYIFLWSALSFALALVPMWRVYREWKKFGGPGNYDAPIPQHMR